MSRHWVSANWRKRHPVSHEISSTTFEGSSSRPSALGRLGDSTHVYSKKKHSSEIIAIKRKTPRKNNTETHLPVVFGFMPVVAPAAKIVVYSYFGDGDHIAHAALPVMHALQVGRGCTQPWLGSLQVDHNLEIRGHIHAVQHKLQRFSGC